MSNLLITKSLLSRAAQRCGFSMPDNGLVFFGIRGASPISSGSTVFLDQHEVRFTAIDHQRMRCTIGQFDKATGQVALFPGSTVPHHISIAAARSRGGRGANMLMPGCYVHAKGQHKDGKPSGHRAFRQDSFMPVRRTSDDDSYNDYDRIDFGSGPGDYIWDNLHSAYHDNPDSGFSSAGCQVVCGLPSSPQRGMVPETGPWRTFIRNAYDTHSGQQRFVYMLFTAEELGVVATTPESSLRQVARYGSSGALTEAVQKALINRGLLAGPADGSFGRNTAMALTEYQIKTFGRAAADGECGAQTAQSLGLTLPLVKGALVPVPAPLPPVVPDATPDIIDDTDLEETALREALRRFARRRGLYRLLGLPEPEETAPVPAPVLLPVPVPQPLPSQVPAGTQGRSAIFEQAQEVIKIFEGGYVNHRDDPGRATNFGITQSTLSNWRGRPVSEADVRNLTYDEAKDIFHARYWVPLGCDGLHPAVALACYNVSVHCGPGRAAEFLQSTLVALGQPIRIDREVGRETFTAAAQVDSAALKDGIIDRYQSFLQGRKVYASFKNGWDRRVRDLRTTTDSWLAVYGVQTLTYGAPGQIADIDDAGETTVAQTTNASAPANRQTGDLTPVNAAMGQLIGKFLDGRKTGWGIVGVLASYLLQPVTTAAPVKTEALVKTAVTAAVEAAKALPNSATSAQIAAATAAVEKIVATQPEVTASPFTQLISALIPALVGAAPGISSVSMPLALALTAWGLLGKVDKYVLGKGRGPVS